MKRMLLVVVAATCAMLPGRPCQAQRDDITVRYLRAAISSLQKNTQVSITAEFMATPGLRDVNDVFLRSKGVSRFSIRDPGNGDVFDNMYCRHDSPAFKDLLAANGRRIYRFSGYRDRGESNSDGVFVTRVEFIREIKEDEAAAPAPGETAATPPRLRVTLIDNTTSNRSVLFNVQPGQSYKLNGYTVQVDAD